MILPAPRAHGIGVPFPGEPMKRHPLARCLPPAMVVWSACNPPPAPRSDLHDGIGGNGPSASPDIEVEPEVVDFGTVSASRRDEHRLTVTISNLGEADLQIQCIELELGWEELEITAAQSVLVRPEQEIWFELVLGPMSADTVIEDYLLIDSDDPDEPTVQVPVYAEAARR